MKNILFVIALCCTFCFQACDTGGRPENMVSVDQVDPGQRQSANLNDEGADGTTAHSTQSAYVCPMRCEESGSHEPGKCPVCKMDLVKNKDHHQHGGTNTRQGEVLNHESEQADDRNMDDKLEPQPR